MLGMHYAVLPPEVNSGRMYAGPGSGSMLAAAAAWEELAGELNSAAGMYGAVISRLTGGPWTGASSAAMAAAAHPYITWLHGTATQAEQTAVQAKTAVNAYSAARTAVVPPAVIAANRARLMMLVQTNLLGQNTALIGVTEGEYAEMWAQDAAVMNGYADSSAAASALSPFSNPPQTTNPGGHAAQAAAALQAGSTAAGTSGQSALSQLSGLLAPAVGSAGSSVSSGSSGLVGISSSLGTVANMTALPGQAFGDSMGGWAGMANLVSNINNFMGLATYMAQNPEGLFGVLNQPFIGPASLSTGGFGLSTGLGPVSVGLGEALKIGAVSVPQGWAMPAVPVSAITPAAAMLPAGAAAPAVANGVSGATFGETMLGTLAGRALSGVAARAVGPRNRTVVPRSPAAG